MPTLRITIKMDNAAFDDGSMTEAARIIRQLATNLEVFAPRYISLCDLNGNTVGEAKVTR